MSWLFSAALVEDCLQAKYWTGEPYSPLNVMPTAHKFWHKDKMIDPLNLSRFGLALRVLTEHDGEELLTLFQAGFPAKTFPRRGGETDLTANDPAFGDRWHESLAKYDHGLRGWRTAQCSLFADLELCLEIWPRWGSMRNGECYQQPMLVQPTFGKESGYLPTPMATDWKGGTTSIRRDTGKQRLDQFRDWIKCLHGLTYPIPEHSEAVMGWPSGWSDLKPLATDKYPSVQQQRSTCCEQG